MASNGTQLRNRNEHKRRSSAGFERVLPHLHKPPTPNVVDGRATKPLGSIGVVIRFLRTHMVIWLQVVGK